MSTIGGITPDAVPLPKMFSSTSKYPSVYMLLANTLINPTNHITALACTQTAVPQIQHPHQTPPLNTKTDPIPVTFNFRTGEITKFNTASKDDEKKDENENQDDDEEENDEEEEEEDQEDPSDEDGDFDDDQESESEKSDNGDDDDDNFSD